MSSSRVAVISVHTSPLDRPGGSKAGGLNVYVLELSKSLARLGWDVDIFSRATSARTPEVTEIAPGVRVIHLRAGPARPLSPAATYRHVESFQRAVIDFNRRDGAHYDVVHSHYWLSGLVGERLKAAWRVPHVAMFHTLGEIKNRASRSENESPLRIRSEASVIEGVERVICAT